MPYRLAQHLIARGLLPARVVDDALKRATADAVSLDTAFLELGVVSEAGILQALSDVSGLRLVNLADFEPNTDAAAHMPFGLAQQLNVVPLSLDGPALHLASAYPVAKIRLRNLGVVLGLRIELWVALECRIRLWQAVLYGKKLDRRYQKLIDAVDPLREAKDLTATVPAEEGRLSSEVLERIARDVAEEPLLLDCPKRPSQRPPKVEEPDNEEPQRIRFPGGVLPPRRSPESTPHPPPPKSPPSRRWFALPLRLRPDRG